MENNLATLLNIRYPIVQAPMLGLSTPEMAAAVSNAGGLGSLAVGGLSPGKTQELIRKTRSLTGKPFAVNFFAHENAAIDRVQAEMMQDFLEKVCADQRIPFERQEVSTFRFYSYLDQMEVLLSENIPVISFTFGIPDTQSIRAFKEKQVILIGTATCLKEAQLLAEAGIDMITAQGIEAGGHRGGFLEDEPLPQVGTLALVAGITAAMEQPVLAAGGIHDGRTMRAAFALGAQGVQIGSAFIASDESEAIPSYKSAVQNARDTDSVLTRSFSGRWARGLRNMFITTVENSGLDIPAYPVQNSLTTSLRKTARQLDNKEWTNLWAGQSASGAEAKPAEAIFNRLVREGLQDKGG